MYWPYWRRNENKRPLFFFKYTEKVTETGRMIVFTVETNTVVNMLALYIKGIEEVL